MKIHGTPPRGQEPGGEPAGRSASPTLIALDVDGTLVDHSGTMSRAVSDITRAAVRAGHHIVVATGRSRGAATPIAGSLGVQEGYVVCSNGAVVLQAGFSREWELVGESTFMPRKALSALQTHLPDAVYAVEEATGEFFSTHRFQDVSFGIEAQCVPFENLLGREAVRVVVHCEDIPLEDFQWVIERVGLHGVTYSVGWSSWLDVAAPGVTKARALEQVREWLGVPREATVAVGDGFNDIDMLSWAHRGVAMGHAPEAVRAAADEVTGSIGDDGAIVVLQEYV